MTKKSLTLTLDKNELRKEIREILIDEINNFLDKMQRIVQKMEEEEEL